MLWINDYIEHFEALFAAALATSMLLIIILIAFWMKTMGPWRGILAGLCRIGWLTPIFLCFFPRSSPLQLPETVKLQPIHVLLDDSDSMRGTHREGGRKKVSWGKSPLEIGDESIKSLREACSRYGCELLESHLSSLDKD